MSAVVYFAHGARVRAIRDRFGGVVLLSAIDNKRLSQTAVWHHFWHRCGFPGTEFGTGNLAWGFILTVKQTVDRRDVSGN